MVVIIFAGLIHHVGAMAFGAAAETADRGAGGATVPVGACSSSRP